MIVCNCNGISERDVKAAIASGASRWYDVHAYHGYEPCCEKCAHEISDTIAEHDKSLRREAARLFGPSDLAAAK